MLLRRYHKINLPSLPKEVVEKADKQMKTFSESFKSVGDALKDSYQPETIEEDKVIVEPIPVKEFDFKKQYKKADLEGLGFEYISEVNAYHKDDKFYDYVAGYLKEVELIEEDE